MLAKIYIDRTALFRTDAVKDDAIKGTFSADKALQLVLALESSRLTLEIKSIPTAAAVEKAILDAKVKIYGSSLAIEKPITGCAQAILSGAELPLGIVTFGI